MKIQKNTICLECGSEIPAHADKCENCGWSWLEPGTTIPKEEIGSSFGEYGSSGQAPACLLCGCQDFTWGIVQGQYDLTFKPDNTSLLGRLTIFGGKSIRARKCNHCKNIQLFVDE